MPPQLFTETPIEAFIVSLFMKAQMAVASIIKGTPAFKWLALGFLLWAIVLGMLRIATHKHHAGQAAVHILYRVGMFYLGFALLGWSVGSIQYLAPSGAPWTGKPGLAPNFTIVNELSNTSGSLSFYYTLHGAFTQFSKTVMNATASVLDPAGIEDSRAVLRELAKMSALSLSQPTQTAFNDMMKNCADTTTGTVVQPNDSMSALWKTTTDPGGPDCAGKYQTLQNQLAAERANAMAKFPPGIWTTIKQKLGMMSDDQVANLALNQAILAGMKAKAGYVTSNWKDGYNDSSPSGASFSSDRQESLTTSVQYGALGGAVVSLAEPLLRLAGIDLRAQLQRAEAASQFNKYAQMIPTTRACVIGILAIMYVLAAFSISFGTWKLMWAWLMAEATMALYQPVAALMWQVMNYYQTQNELIPKISAVANDPLVAGGGQIMQDQLVRMQTTYLTIEVAVFAVFVLGAAAMFKPMSSFIGGVGAGLMSQVGGMAAGALAAGRAMSRAAGGGTTVNVNGSAGAPAGGSNGTLSAGATGGGFQPRALLSSGVNGTGQPPTDSERWGSNTVQPAQRGAIVLPGSSLYTEASSASTWRGAGPSSDSHRAGPTSGAVSGAALQTVDANFVTLPPSPSSPEPTTSGGASDNRDGNGDGNANA
jgi:hypothetical protein